MRPADLLALARSGELAGLTAGAPSGNGHGAQPPVVDYVRFKPGTSCVFGIGTATPYPVGYVKFFLGGGEDECFEKYRSRARGAGLVERVPGHAALLFRFPLDRSVTGLRRLVEIDRLKHVLHECVPGLGPDEERVRARRSSLSILRYKPERRCIVRAVLATRGTNGAKHQRIAIAQAYADDSGARVCGVMRKLHRMPSEWLRVPRPLGWSPASRILIQEAVPGRPWGEDLAGRDADRGAEIAGRMLRELDACPPAPELPMTDAWSTTETAVRVLQDLRRVGDRDLSAAAADLAATLTRGVADLAAMRESTLHGDFHYHQLLVDDTGGTLIDWDEARRGDPREDAGNFVAHLMLRELQGRLDPATASRLRELFLGARFGRERVPGVGHFAAVGLAKLALLPFRNLADDWAAQSFAIVDLARAIAATPSGAHVMTGCCEPLVRAADRAELLRLLDADIAAQAIAKSVPCVARGGRRIDELRAERIDTDDRGAITLTFIVRLTEVRTGTRSTRPFFARSIAEAEGPAFDEAGRVGDDATLGVRFWMSPADPKLPALAASLEPHAHDELAAEAGLPRRSIRSDAARATILAHRFGRRATVRAQLGPGRPSLLLKISRTPPRGTVVCLRALQSAGLGVRVPHVFAEDPRRLILDWIPGRPLHLRGDGAVLGAIERFGGAVQAMQSVPTSGLPEYRAIDELDTIRRFCRRLEPLAPEIASGAGAAAEAAAPVAVAIDSGPLVLSHRDLHDKQMILSRGGPALIDWDLAAAAPIGLDAGNFLAHLTLRSLQGQLPRGRAGAWRRAFLAGLRSDGGDAPDPFWERMALVRLAAVYALRPSWQHLSAALLESAASRRFDP